MKEILKKIGLMFTTLAILSFTAIGSVGIVNATNPIPKKGPANPQDAVCAGTDKAITDGCSDTDVTMDNVWIWVGTVTTWLLMAVGAISVIFIIIGGVKYATSGGDADKVKSAKNTLLYAIVGLAVALLAGLIVQLVTGAAIDATTSA